MRNFLRLWTGQVFSIVGSSISGFALGIWAWEMTGKATPLAMVGFYFMLPMMVMSPFAGVWVDRLPRKIVMAISDIAAGIATFFLLVMFLNGRLEIWNIYIAAIINGLGQAFQWPAYSAAMSTMLPKEQYTRANALVSMAESGSQIFAPILAAALYPLIGLRWILVIDLSTLSLALFLLFLTKVPPVNRAELKEDQKGTFFSELAYGFKFVFQRKPLLHLQIGFMLVNLFMGVRGAFATPLILSRTDNNLTLLGTIQSASAIGGLLGGMAMAAWGGMRRKSLMVTLGWTSFGFFGGVLFGLARSAPLWLAASFLDMFFMPLANNGNQSLWQSKVPPSLQGRVFSVRRLIAMMVSPIAAAVAGPLADKVFEPGMAQAGSLINQVFTPIVGSGAGSGMSALALICGILGMTVGIYGWLNPNVRNADSLLPDHDESQDAQAAAEPSPGPEPA